MRAAVLVVGSIPKRVLLRTACRPGLLARDAFGTHLTSGIPYQMGVVWGKAC